MFLAYCALLACALAAYLAIIAHESDHPGALDVPGIVVDVGHPRQLYRVELTLYVDARDAEHATALAYDATRSLPSEIVDTELWGVAREDEDDAEDA